MTLIHEWAHETMHRQWVSEKDRRRLPMTVRDCQAEAASYVVSHFLGLEHPFARDYLLSHGNTAEELVANLDQVKEASHFMIGRLNLTVEGRESAKGRSLPMEPKGVNEVNAVALE